VARAILLKTENVFTGLTNLKCPDPTMTVPVVRLAILVLVLAKMKMVNVSPMNKISPLI
jgi:hypothetical protein